MAANTEKTSPCHSWQGASSRALYFPPHRPIPRTVRLCLLAALVVSASLASDCAAAPIVLDLARDGLGSYQQQQRLDAMRAQTEAIQRGLNQDPRMFEQNQPRSLEAQHALECGRAIMLVDGMRFHSDSAQMQAHFEAAIAAHCR